jgi:hypothetical protein
MGKPLNIKTAAYKMEQLLYVEYKKFLSCGSENFDELYTKCEAYKSVLKTVFGYSDVEIYSLTNKCKQIIQSEKIYNS